MFAMQSWFPEFVGRGTGMAHMPVSITAALGKPSNSAGPID